MIDLFFVFVLLPAFNRFKPVPRSPRACSLATGFRSIGAGSASLKGR